MAVNDDERRAPGEQIEPRPFDQEGPTVRLFVERLADAAGSRVHGREAPTEGAGAAPLVASGAVRVILEATDEAGVALADDGGPAVSMVVLGGLPPDALTLQAPTASPGVQRTRRIEGVLDLGRVLPANDGRPITIALTARDLLDQETRRLVQITPDNLAPLITLRPPEGVGIEGEGDWHTRSVDDLVFGLQVEDASPMQVAVLFAEDAGLHRVGGERLVQVDLPLRVGQRPEGVAMLRVTATDVLNRTAERTVRVHIDRTAPTLERLPSDFIDERAAEVGCIRGEGLPFCALRLGDARIDLGPEAPEPMDVFKIQTRLGAEDDNLPALRFRVADAAGGTPPSHIQVAFGDTPDHVWGVPADALDERRLILSGEVLGIPNPLIAIPDDGTLWPPAGRGTLVIRDLAGNEAQVDLPTLRLHILAPPLFVVEEPLEPTPGVADATALDAEGLSAAARAGDALAFGRWAIYNPWPMAVSYQIDRPALESDPHRRDPARDQQ
ncbi:MAG: hypothetical protein R3F43_09395 [bacterium]